MEETIVSVILPFFNGKQFLEEAVESVRTQTYSHFELLIIDDGSTDPDESLYASTLVAKYDDPRIKYLYKENGGLSDARNFGFHNSTGELICFIDQDDLWMENKLQLQTDVLKKYTDINVVITNGSTIGEKVIELDYRKSVGLIGGVVENTYERMLRSNIAATISVMFRRSILSEIGECNRYYFVCPDYEFIIRMARNNNFFFLEERLFKYRLHPKNTSKNLSRLYAEILTILFVQPLNTRREKLSVFSQAIRVWFRLGGLWLREKI